MQEARPSFRGEGSGLGGAVHDRVSWGSNFLGEHLTKSTGRFCFDVAAGWGPTSGS